MIVSHLSGIPIYETLNQGLPLFIFKQKPNQINKTNKLKTKNRIQ